MTLLVALIVSCRCLSSGHVAQQNPNVPQYWADVAMDQNQIEQNTVLVVLFLFSSSLKMLGIMCNGAQHVAEPKQTSHSSHGEGGVGLFFCFLLCVVVFFGPVILWEWASCATCWATFANQAESLGHVAQHVQRVPKTVDILRGGVRTKFPRNLSGQAHAANSGTLSVVSHSLSRLI